MACPHCSRPQLRSCWRVQAGEIPKVFYYTYVLKSRVDSHLYIGWTIDLKNRLKKHNLGKVFATKNRFPLKLIYYEASLNKRKAILREKQLKTGFGRKYLKNRI